jgi:alkanesulfonate monooxygenase SsuD/methylene tetrahydromethanopterin reductase-like flavin-dependent oxidoreductase (luciferase family)
VEVGVMVTAYNHGDWDRLLGEDYGRAPTVSDVDLIDECLKLGEMVEPLGFDSLWSTEHYGSAYSMQANPLQWLAYWAGRTERIDLGSAVIVAPWWQPMKLAHEIAMLDLLLRGRKFHIGIGRGVSAHEYAGFGVDREESRDRFREMIEILRLADDNERTPQYDGSIYHVPPFSVRPRARHKGELFGNIKAAFNTPASMEMAADLGLGQLFVAAETIDKMRAQVTKFNSIRAAKGLPPNQPTTMLYLHCSTDPDEIAKGHFYVRQQGMAARNHYAVWNSGDFTKVKGYEEYAQAFAAGADKPDEGLESFNTAELIGTPEQIYEKIKMLQDEISLEYLIVHANHGGKSGPEARASLKLFAEEVLPAVHELPTDIHEQSLGSAEGLDLAVGVGTALG